MSLDEVRLENAGRLFQLPDSDHQNITLSIIKRSSVHVDPHLLSKSLRVGTTDPVTRRKHPITTVDLAAQQQGASAGPSVLPVSTVSQPGSDASKISRGGKSIAMSLIAVIFECTGHVGRCTPPLLRWPSFTIAAPGPLFPQYERIVALGTRGGKSRERQVQCLKLHVMAMMRCGR